MPDDDIARAILDVFYDLPDTVHEGAGALHERFTDAVLEVVSATSPDGRSFTREPDNPRSPHVRC